MTDDKPLPDLPLLRKVVEWVEEQDAKPAVDREWYQKDWRTPAAWLGRYCGTCYCVAGYVAEISGGEWCCSVGLRAAPGEASYAAGLVFANVRAQRLLGLTDVEAAGLFSGSNTAADVRRVAEGIAARAGQRL